MEHETAPASKGILWTGRVIVALSTLFFLFDGVMKVAAPPSMVEQMTKMGFPAASVMVLGIVLVLSTIAYAIPATSVFGAVMITGYLGGAVATNLRSGASLFGLVLLPVYFGILLWAGVFLRDPRVRTVFPIRW
jgi:hypothetical protein